MAEPAVLTADIRRVLREVIRPESDDVGEAVQRIADRATTSTRTVYRVLNPKPDEGESATLSLDLADRLALAAGRQLSEIGCRVLIAGRVVAWEDA